jgi:hypothetical protein
MFTVEDEVERAVNLYVFGSLEEEDEVLKVKRVIVKLSSLWVESCITVL